jgi:hypothetical protein
MGGRGAPWFTKSLLAKVTSVGHLWHFPEF